MVLQYLKRPVRFDYIRRHVNDCDTFRILDVGCGNNSPAKTRAHFPNCVYHGLDRDHSQDLSKADVAAMDAFYEIDLSAGNLMEIQECWYDCVIFSHVLEHLSDGLRLVPLLAGKLRKGGVLYIETPSERSVTLPRMAGTLNFFDDDTHRRLYSREEISDSLRQANCDVICCEIRRSVKRIIATPFYAAYSLLKYRKIIGPVFWDITGFASVVIGRKR